MLFQVVFSFALGPLAWSVALFRNSLVIHSQGHMLSLFIHLFPPLIVFIIRWCTDGAAFNAEHCGGSSGGGDNRCFALYSEGQVRDERARMGWALSLSLSLSLSCVCVIVVWHDLLTNSLHHLPQSSFGLYEAAIQPFPYWLAWAAAYYTKVFVVSRSKVKKRKYDTLYKYVTKDEQSECREVRVE